jgi:hypothetical protein
VSWRRVSITGSITSCIMFVFDVDLWQESDSCAHVPEKWLVFEAGCTCSLRGSLLTRRLSKPHRPLGADQAFHVLSLDYCLATLTQQLHKLTTSTSPMTKRTRMTGHT